MKDKRESDKHTKSLIKVLGATFFMVGLCPHGSGHRRFRCGHGVLLVQMVLRTL